GTSVWKAKHPRVRPNETTPISPTRRPGSGKVRVRRRHFTRNRSLLPMFRSPKGVTNDYVSHTEDLAAAKRGRTGQVRHLSGQGRDTGHVIPGNARRPQ